MVHFYLQPKSFANSHIETRQNTPSQGQLSAVFWSSQLYQMGVGGWSLLTSHKGGVYYHLAAHPSFQHGCMGVYVVVYLA